MKAITYYRYGAPEVLQIEELPKPEPAPDEVLVKVHATSVNAADWRLRKADPLLVRPMFGLFKPNIRVLGAAYAGEVAAAGANVSRFKVGDAIFGCTDKAVGAYAQFITMKANGPIATKPENVSFEEAAAIPFGAHTAWHFLKKLGDLAEKQVMVYGASGAVGTAAVQMLKHKGAHVTAVCSTRNVELVKDLGADTVIDYMKQDPLQTDIKFDIIIETVGKAPVDRLADLLVNGGKLNLISAMLADSMKAMLVKITKGADLVMGTAEVDKNDMQAIAVLVSNGVLKPVVEKVYPMNEIVEAHRYVEQGHKRGNVAITML